MNPYLEGKVAVVTGVSSGLGRGVARAFAQRGATVVGCARRAEAGASLEAEISAAGGRFRYVQCDIAEVGQCEALVKGVVERHGRLDILVNNAGSSGERPVRRIEQMTEADWDAVQAVNLRAAFTLTRLALPPMQARRSGVILNIASINARIGVANMASYNASKAGLVHLTNTTAVENVAHGVRAIAIILGGVTSEMNRAVALEMGRSVRGPDWTPSAAWEARAASGMGDPDDYGRALALLCADDAAPITGAVIALDGAASAGSIASSMIYIGSAELI
jgi:NAD(P)-dependent dehydrogenase (short-subunit alcohol dehydrogenase family)